MRKIIFIVFAILLFALPAHAFLYSLEILTVDQIKSLADDKIVETYTEAVIEDKASGEFIRAAGFSSAKDYEQRKTLLRYIINLRREMVKRGIEPEPLQDWLQ